MKQLSMDPPTSWARFLANQFHQEQALITDQSWAALPRTLFSM